MDQSIRLRRPDEIESEEVPTEYRAPANFVFITSSPSALKADLGDRRFTVIDLTSKE